MFGQSRQDEGWTGALDAFLPQTADMLTRVLADCQREFAYYFAASVEAYSEYRRRALLLLRATPQGLQHEYFRAIADRAARARASYLAAYGGDRLPAVLDKRAIVDQRGGLVLCAGDLQAHCDMVTPARRDGSSAVYEPLLVSGTAVVAPGQRLRLAFAGHVIGEASGNHPTHGTLIPFGGKPLRVRLVSLYPGIVATVVALRFVCRLASGVTPVTPFYALAARGTTSARNTSSFSRSAGVIRSPRQRRKLARIVRGRPLLRGLRELVDLVYALFDRRCRTETAIRKLECLRRHKLFQAYPQLEAIRRKLMSPNLEKALLFLDDSMLEATSNAVDRENRRHRKRQKTIYRARTRRTIAGRIRFSILHDLEPDILKLPETRYRLPNSKAG